MNNLFRFLSILVSTLSVVSLFQRMFDVGIAVVFSDVIEYYRLVTYQTFGFIGLLLSIKFPPTLMDLWVISFIGAGAYIRTENIEGSRLLRNIDTNKFPKYWKFIMFLFMGLGLMGIGIILSAIQPQTFIDDMSDEHQDLIMGALKNIAWILLGLVVFFAINAYAPSI